MILTAMFDKDYQLFLIDLHGQFLRTLVKTRGDHMFCNQAANLAYYSAPEPGSPGKFLWSVSLAGGKASKVMTIPDAGPLVYSNDGKYAAYLVAGADNSEARLIDIAQRRVVKEFVLANHAKQTLPHFTPDGKALAFVAQENDGFALAFQPLDSGKIYLAPTRSKAPIVDFGWSPAGKSLAILADHSTSDVAILTDTSASSKK
jgi:Tol biopolymer transport system component